MRCNCPCSCHCEGAKRLWQSKIFPIRRRIGVLGLFIFIFLQTAFAKEGPTLIDIVAKGTLEDPELSISETTLKQGEPYLLVILNNNPFALTLGFEKFGQAVFTQSMQGASSVSQEEITLLPHNKIVWQLVANEPGEFSFFVNTNKPVPTEPQKKLKVTILAAENKDPFAEPKEETAQKEEKPTEKPVKRKKFFGRD